MMKDTPVSEVTERIIRAAISGIEHKVDGNETIRYTLLDAILSTVDNDPNRLVDLVRQYLGDVYSMWDGDEKTAYTGSTLEQWEKANGQFK